MYLPLPSYLTIKESDIHGLGLFATEDIEANYFIGITHVKDEGFENGFIRTPLGGFFNHSDDPNCSCLPDGELLVLSTIKPIKAGEEITVKYWLYDIK